VYTYEYIRKYICIYIFRFLHASDVVGRKIVVHGGWNETETLGDIWIFNTDSFAWQQPRTSGFAPTPRYGHSLNLTPDGRLLVFGGTSISKESNGLPRYNDDLRVLNTDTMIWSRPRVEGPVPTGRYGHSSKLLGNFFYFLLLSSLCSALYLIFFLVINTL
jgi:host cell factor